MRQVIRAFLALVVIAIFLPSCSLSPGSGDWPEGYWSTESFASPTTNVVQLQSGGTATAYSDYACTVVEGSGTWSVANDVVTIDIGGASDYFKVDNDTMTIFLFTLYRKGTEPEGQLSLGSAAALPVVNSLSNGSLTAGGYVLYSFNAVAGTTSTSIGRIFGMTTLG